MKSVWLVGLALCEGFYLIGAHCVLQCHTFFSHIIHQREPTMFCLSSIRDQSVKLVECRFAYQWLSHLGRCKCQYLSWLQSALIHVFHIVSGPKNANNYIDYCNKQREFNWMCEITSTSILLNCLDSSFDRKDGNMAIRIQQVMLCAQTLLRIKLNGLFLAWIEDINYWFLKTVWQQTKKWDKLRTLFSEVRHCCYDNIVGCEMDRKLGMWHLKNHLKIDTSDNPTLNHLCDFNNLKTEFFLNHAY